MIAALLIVSPILMYLAASLIALVFILIPFLRHRIFDCFDKGFNEIYEKFEDNWYSRHYGKRQRNITQYIKYTIYCYYIMLKWNIREMVSPNRKITNINSCDYSRYQEDYKGAGNSIPNLINNPFSNKSNNRFNFCLHVKSIIKRVSTKCKQYPRKGRDGYFIIASPISWLEGGVKERGGFAPS